MPDAISVLQSEFQAGDGSFLLQLRCDLCWDETAFARLIQAMFDYVRTRDRDADIPRWVAEGFWYLDWFVREWSEHPDFPRKREQSYYAAAYGRLHGLAFYLFTGVSPCEDPASLASPI